MTTARPATYEQSQWSITWRALRRDPLAMTGLATFLFLVVVSIAAPWVAPYSPTEIDRKNLLEAPNAVHLWGTDDMGRDVLSRVIWGGRESLKVGVLAIVIGVASGSVVGLISGFYGWWVDSIIQRCVEIMLAFPNILLLLTIVAVLGSGLSTVLVALGISSIPRFARLVRGSVLATSQLEYVTAARLVGAKNGRIMFRHILPNVIPPIIVYGTVGLAANILSTAGLSYIGLGARPPSPEWGALLNSGRLLIRDAWWMSAFPGLAVFLAVLSVNLLGDGLRDALDPKLRRR